MANPDENSNYALDLPPEEMIRQMLATQLELYSERNAMIAKFRQHIDGQNPIAAPKSVQFKVVVQHGYGLRSVMEEKASRYRRVPEIKISPDTLLKTDQKKADELEKSTNRVMELIEMAGGESTWSQMSFDVNMLDGAVERIESAPAAFWPELLVTTDDKGVQSDKFSRLYQDAKTYADVKEKYKREAGIPIRTVWVPLERFFPVFEGRTMVECFEIEERSLRSVRANKQFDTSRLQNLNSGRQDGGLGQKVVILHYCNQTYHAYYALGPSATSSTSSVGLASLSANSVMSAQPILLYAYKHKIGMPIYNFVRGRGSGWLNGANPRISGVMKAMLDINQDLDELTSQIATFIRNVLWATRVMKFSPENRGADEGLPTVPEVPEGGLVGMWNDEKIEDLVSSLMQQNELVQFFYRMKREQLAALAGSGALTGQHQAGVNAGYHEQLQISQAEHLDALAEENMAFGAANRVRIIYRHIRALNESIPVHLALKGANGKPGGKWLSIDPKQLEPMPNIGAKVRDPRPIDLITTVQAMLQATQMRPGHNTPLMPDEWAWEQLGVTDGALIDMQRTERMLTNKLWQSDPLFQALAKAFGMAVVQSAQQQPLTPEEAAGASPAMQQAAAAAIESGATAQQGGVSAATQNAMMAGRAASGAPAAPPAPQPPAQEAPTSGMGGVMRGVGGGPRPGAPQPQQAAGRAAQLLAEVTG